MAALNVGEHFIPGTSRITEIESFHRYIAAAELCRQCKVLDAASGDGYGSVILAEKAASVTGIDLNEEAVRTAREKYRRDNLDFVYGNVQQMPFPDDFFDRIVSFETIEHIASPQRFLAESRRILKPDGVLILSSPNKKAFDRRNRCEDGGNQFHVNEMEQPELEILLRPLFEHIAFYDQDAFYCSEISGDEKKHYFVKDKEGKLLAQTGLQKAQYSLVLASDAALPSLAGSSMIDAFFDPEYGYCLDDEAVVNQFGLRGEFERSLQKIQEMEGQIRSMQENWEHCRSDFSHSQAELEKTQRELSRTQTDLTQTRNELLEKQAALTQCQDDFAQSMAALDQSRREFANSQVDLAQSRSELSQTRTALEEGRNDLVQSQVDLARIREDLTFSKLELDKRGNDLSLVREELNRIRTALAEREEELTVRSGELAESRAEIAALHAGLTDRERKLQQVQSELDVMRVNLKEEHDKSEEFFRECSELRQSWALRIFGRFASRRKIRQTFLAAGKWFKPDDPRLGKERNK